MVNVNVDNCAWIRIYKCIITMIITLLMIHDALAKGPFPNPVEAYKTEQPAGANPLVFALNLNYQGQSSDHVNIISFRMCIFYSFFFII